MIEIIQKSRATDMALHDLCQNALRSLMQRKDIGFIDLPHRVQLWNESQKLAQIWRDKFHQLVVLGIGGSSLGARAILEVFNGQNVIIIDNVDPIAFKSETDKIKDWNKTAWAVISKSGTTIETLCALEHVHQIYQSKNLRLDQKCVVITEPVENSLGRWAQEFSIPQLEIPLDVGGRYSVLSPVGIFVAAFLGVNIEAIRQGALRSLKNTTLLTQLMAQFMGSFHRQEWITQFWFYTSRMKWFGLWWVQLWAESLGKKTNRLGKDAPRVSTPMTATGATDQHSILQQVMEGTKDKFVVFWRFDDSEGQGETLTKNIFPETAALVGRKMGTLLAAEAQSTCEALTINGVSTMTLKAKSLDEETLGEMFMTLQVLVGGLGELLEINAFDQPGVELGKRLAKEKLSKA